MSHEPPPPSSSVSQEIAVEDASAGRVWFVGAGPGAADLLTLRAHRLLEAADVVLYDVLVPPHLLGTLRPEVEQIPVCRDDPSTGTRYVDAGAAVGNLLVSLAQQGRRVVRLKGGDPSVFARLSEEVLPLKRAGVAYDIVPGVTAATAAAAAIAAPLTSRRSASSVTLITGHRALPTTAPEGRSSSDDFSRLASLPGTVVVYMGLEQLDRWTQALLDAGCPAERPVAVISRCGWPDERRCITTIGALRDNEAVRSWPSPAVIIVGEVLAPSLPAAPAGVTPPLAHGSSPLAGQRVLITRPAGQADELLSLLSRAGAHGVCLPVIEIVPPDSWAPLDSAIREAWSFDWIVFSSTNGVQAFAHRLAAAGDARLLATARLAAVGPKTAAALAAEHLACDLVPETHSAAGLLEAWTNEPPGRRFLLVQADRGRDTLQRELTAQEHHVERVTAYVSRDVPRLDAAAEALLAADTIDWIILSSPAITHSAVQLYGQRLAGWNIACNSPASAEVLAAHGFCPTVVSDSPSMAAVVDAMQAWQTTVKTAQNSGQDD